MEEKKGGWEMNVFLLGWTIFRGQLSVLGNRCLIICWVFAIKDAKNEGLFQGSLDVGLGFQALEKPIIKGTLNHHAMSLNLALLLGPYFLGGPLRFLMENMTAMTEMNHL